MEGKGCYVPPRYIPLGQSEVEVVKEKDEHPASRPVGEWSSGICACFDDTQSCKLLSALNLKFFEENYGCFVACYACGYRRALRSKYNLPEAPYGDFVTHFFCHLCAVCQEYREITERSGNSEQSNLSSAVVSAPPAQVMQLPSYE